MENQNTQTSPIALGLHQFGRQCAFAFNSRRTAILMAMAIIFFLLFDCAIGWTFADGLKTLWDKEINQVMTVATLLVALSVWWGDIIRGWREALPKKFTVDFTYASEEDTTQKPVAIMRCINADLSDVADIRALGQQIGCQLVNPDNPITKLSFSAPCVKQGKGNINFLPGEGFFKHFEVEFILTSPPKELDTSKCKIWRAPFRKKDIEICDLK